MTDVFVDTPEFVDLTAEIFSRLENDHIVMIGGICTSVFSTRSRQHGAKVVRLPSSGEFLQLAWLDEVGDWVGFDGPGVYIVETNDTCAKLPASIPVINSHIKSTLGVGPLL